MKYFSFLCCLFLALSSHTQNIQELGKITWLRDYDKALAKCEVEEKSVLILFQEIPGCSTCRNYGDQVLSDPLIKDVLEHYFIPLAIYNNKKGKDQKILSLYKEPSWNNPVVRIVNKKGEDLISRVNGNYSRAGLVSAMIQSFSIQNKPVPQDLRLLQSIVDTKPTEEIVYSMYCFWSGEKTFGKIEGVYNTEAGWQNGREVVFVEYDPNVISKKELTQKGKSARCADEVYAEKDGFRKDKDPKYYLKNSRYKYLPMHSLQAARINSLLGEGVEDLEEWLFPSQQKYLARVEENKSEILYEQNFDSAWEEMLEQL